MTSITLDGLNEEEFRRSIEARLRHDLAGAAVDRLRALLAPYAGPGGILPERFLTVSASDLNFYGWDGLADALRRHDRPGRPITALSITFGWPGEDAPQPDADGRLTPHLETSYFNDDAYPFSQSGREDLLDGYSYHGCTWGDDCEARETTLSLGGVDDLHGALATLENRLLSSEEPDEEEIRAGSLGSCLLSVLLFQAVGQRIARDGLPRPLCVMAGSNGVYPYFDAPVVGLPEEARKAGEAAEELETRVDSGIPGPRYSSLLVTGIPRARKRAVLVLEESEDETAVRIANLRGLHHRSEPEQGAPEKTAASASDRPAPLPNEQKIIPVANGPLMVKKPSAASNAWDFRDMLGPRDSDEPAQDAAPATPEPPQAPKTPAPDLPAIEPVSELLPRPRFPREALPEPGFALLEPTVADRLQSLITPQSAPESNEPAPPPVRSVETDMPPVERRAASDAGPTWPLGIGWLEDQGQQPPKPAEPASPPRNQGLWTRLRAWFRRRK